MKRALDPRRATAGSRGGTRCLLLMSAAALAVAGVPPRTQAADLTIYPSADGTIADGGPFGPCDGIPDAWDWSFNASGYEGAITRVTQPAQNAIEQRVVWEYNLSAVLASTPVAASLTFTLRGTPRFPAAPTLVVVYGYPADLRESAEDFARGPAVFVGSQSVQPYQPATAYTIDVSAWVNHQRDAGADAVGFRFEVDPDSPNGSDQAFIDASDATQSSKPFLTVRAGLPGDIDDDGDLDLADFAAIRLCLAGPDKPVGSSCTAADLDFDDDVDLRDIATFTDYHSQVGQ